MPNSSQREYNVDRNGAFNVWMANSVVLQKRTWISIRFKIVYRMARTTIRTQEVVAQLGAGGGGRTGKQSGSMIYDACRSPTVVRSRRDFLKRQRE